LATSKISKSVPRVSVPEISRQRAFQGHTGLPGLCSLAGRSDLSPLSPWPAKSGTETPASENGQKYSFIKLNLAGVIYILGNNTEELDQNDNSERENIARERGLMRPKARALVQHVGPFGWLEESTRQV
jgi:hypothetical protein